MPMQQHIINQVHKILLKKQKTVAVAESCTAGLLSHLLTYISGSSGYFILGVVVYSNKAKESILKIPISLIARKGAVSPEVALKLAQNVRKLARTDLGIGITGIAGPTGGTPGKPVGTCFIAVASKNKSICRKFRFKGNRSAVRKKSALRALGLLKLFL